MEDKTTRKSLRNARPVKRFSFDEYDSKKEKVKKFVSGDGYAISKNKGFVKKLMKFDEKKLKIIHGILYGFNYPCKDMTKEILRFKGYGVPDGEDAEALTNRIESRIYRRPKAEVKRFAQAFGFDLNADYDDLCEVVINFILIPFKLTTPTEKQQKKKKTTTEKKVKEVTQDKQTTKKIKKPTPTDDDVVVKKKKKNEQLKDTKTSSSSKTIQTSQTSIISNPTQSPSTKDIVNSITPSVQSTTHTYPAKFLIKKASIPSSSSKQPKQPKETKEKKSRKKDVVKDNTTDVQTQKSTRKPRKRKQLENNNVSVDLSLDTGSSETMLEDFIF
ncbi:hypothetical protein QTN25_003010 [Entamoeba marina]